MEASEQVYSLNAAVGLSIYSLLVPPVALDQ